MQNVCSRYVICMRNDIRNVHVNLSMCIIVPLLQSKTELRGIIKCYETAPVGRGIQKGSKTQCLWHVGVCGFLFYGINRKCTYTQTHTHIYIYNKRYNITSSFKTCQILCKIVTTCCCCFR